ncbi:MspA family porin [Rhodococcus sp. HM1]|uniref:MspA family porin n=1 Tax=Rhodococcus sp. HM1 TaxID=2937759 RepID=UPI00200A96FF|nr:MspA family porin [Rhodococcus sp. HM1]MCK8669981.1 MspA family porin [Rhodococcus sp. HM1]
MVRNSVTKSRRRFRVAALGVAAAAFVAMVNPGAAGAAVDNARSMPLDGGATIEVLQADTSIQSVPPLDSSPLSVEFFSDGVAAVKITGPGADAFTGTKLTLGYQIGYPVALPGAIVHLFTPSLDWGVGNNVNLGFGDLLGDPVIGLDLGANAQLGGRIIPEHEFEIELEPGGITEVPIVEGLTFDGSAVTVRIAGVHGSVSGAIGPVTVRPFAKATTSKGDTVVTYGVPQRV